jgi:hypothetical protein
MEAMRLGTGEWVVDASAMVLSVPWNADQNVRAGKHEIIQVSVARCQVSGREQGIGNRKQREVPGSSAPLGFQCAASHGLLF